MQLAREHGLALHLDGARLWNAHVATGTPLAELAAGVRHRVGLPVEGPGRAGRLGAGVHGRADRRGPGLAQALRRAACGRPASWPRPGCTRSTHHLARLADDHARARRLAAGARRRPVAVDTNIVVLDVADAAVGRGGGRRARRAGVRARPAVAAPGHPPGRRRRRRRPRDRGARSRCSTAAARPEPTRGRGRPIDLLAHELPTAAAVPAVVTAGPGGKPRLRGRTPLRLALIFGVLGVALFVVGGVVLATNSLGKVNDFERVSSVGTGTVHLNRTGNYVGYYEAPTSTTTSSRCRSSRWPCRARRARCAG